MNNLNIKNRTIFCRDNLDILQGINSNCVDLIYLDPPFNKKKEFTAPMGSSAEGASFRDWFKEEDVKDDWLQTIKEDYDGIYQFLTSVRSLSSFQSHKNKHYLYNYCYLCYMAVRLIEMHRILKDTGSIYLHCDPTMSHYLKILMDLIFGEKNFRNEIVWNYTRSKGLGASKYQFPRKHDIIFFYTKTVNNTHIFKEQRFKDNRPVSELRKIYAGDYFYCDDKGYIEWAKIKHKKGNQRERFYKKFFDKYKRAPKDGDKIFIMKDPIVKSVWSDIKILNDVVKSKERTGYPTQKPIKLLERIIKASSNEGDVVLDPFCGCATTCVASEKLKRQWIGVDISIKAYDLVRERLKKEVANPENIFDYEKILNFSITPPKRTDTNGEDNIVKKYVYIISNPNIPGEYKVGIAKDWKSRLTSYQTSHPDRNFKIEYKIHTHLFREIEKHIHNKFENKHEWVREKLENIINEIENYK